MKFEPRYSEENVNVLPRNYFLDFLRLSLYVLGIIFGIYFVLGFIADEVAKRLSPQFEKAIAASLTSAFNHNDFPHTRDYLQKVLNTLVASTEGLPEFSYQVSVYDHHAVNAAELPAGHIIVFKGLLSALKSENEIAMILGHELGHYAHRDHLRGSGRALVLLAITTTLGLSGDIPGFIAPSVQTLNLKHSRDQESAADHFAMDLFVRAYGHAGGTIDAFRILARQEKEPGMSDFFSTHPDILWRIESLTDHSRKYPQGPIKSLPGSAGRLPFPEDIKQ